jgi:hypothetical protein
VPALADGAAYDPRTGSWRSLARAPVPIADATGVVVGTSAFVWIPGDPRRPGSSRAFLEYRIDGDTWRRLRPPSRDPDRQHSILAAGDRIVALSGTDEQGEQPDLVYDAASDRWRELPADPLSPSFDRTAAWSGRELILFAKDLVPNPGSERPALVRAAALDLGEGTWRPLPDSETLGAGRWVAVQGRLFDPALGGADGGEVNGWGRTYPNGGILDPASGEWSSLPDPPTTGDPPARELGSGILTASGGEYWGHRGWILDATGERWIEIPVLDDRDAMVSRTAVAAGDALLVFGGTRWAGRQGTLLDEAWIWSPRAAPRP